MISEQDDHIPAPAAPTKAVPKSAASAPVLRTGWGDRLLFASLGLLLGFAAAYLYIERVGGPGAGPRAADPHAGIPGFEAGATRDLPGAGGGAAPIGGGSAGVSVDPQARQQIAMLEAAAAKDPKNYDLLVKLGNAAYDANDPRLAADSYEKALAVKGGDPNVLTDLGVSYRNLGDLDRALQNFDRALKSDPAHWQAAFNKVVVLGLDKGDEKTAREQLAKLKKTNQNIPALDQLEKELDKASKGR
jgi:hypothetical protein